MSESVPEPFFIQAKKSLGQHFLHSPIVPNWMCDAAHLKPKEVVIEVGPGTGVLTTELLARGTIVHAIETDSRSYELLESRFATAIKAKQLFLHQADIRDGIPKEIPIHHTYKVVANIPYYLSGHLLRLFLETTHQPTTLVFLMQKEVVERITRYKKESLLSLSIQLFGNASYIRTVSRGHFVPPPRVDSAILAITDIQHRHLPPEELARFFTLLHAGFAHKRKQLFGNLKSYYPPEELSRIFTILNISPTIRAEDIPLTTWLALHHQIQTL